VALRKTQSNEELPTTSSPPMAFSARPICLCAKIGSRDFAIASRLRSHDSGTAATWVSRCEKKRR